MRITFSIDDQVVAEARRFAAARGISLNQLVRDFLEELVRRGDPEAAIAELKAVWAAESYRSEGPWTRDELRERT